MEESEEGLKSLLMKVKVESEKAGGSDGKESAYSAGDPGLIPGSERSSGGKWLPTPLLPEEFYG